MCGFVSIHCCDQELDEYESVLEEMMQSIAHRGPDGEGYHHVPRQALFGHKRLAIIDLAHGAQPMISDDNRYTLVYNGEIYNYKDIHRDLISSGYNFVSESDTEVLFRALIHWGTNVISKLNGMFSFVFHDRLTNRWIAARDHFGIKPLYFANVKNHLVFGSEIKALLKHPQMRAVVDKKSLHQYVAFQFCLDDNTLFKGINKVKPGYFLTGLGSKIEKSECYWETNYQVDNHHTEDYFIEKLRYLLEDSIRLQIQSDVPVGGYLSGGLDSSLVCSLSSRKFSEKMHMFHGRFSEGLEYDESVYAKELANFTSGYYHEVVPTAQDFVNDLPKLIYSLDEPLAGPGLFPQFAVSRLAKEHVTVVLGGQGGDEIFGGYARYLVGYLEQALKGAIFETQEEGKHLVTLESIVPNLSLLKQYKPLLSNFWSNGLFEDMDARYFHLIDRSQGTAGLIHPDTYNSFDKKELFTDFQSIFNHPDTKSYINKMTHFDQKTLLPALLQIEDRVSMAVSLESRVPLLDKRIVDLVTSMPPPLKFQGGRSKHILKKTIQDLVPELILNRKDKMGFPVPIKEWMQGGCVREFVTDTLLSKKSLERGVFDTNAIHSLFDAQGVGARQLWGVLSLELWYQRFIDG